MRHGKDSGDQVRYEALVWSRLRLVLGVLKGFCHDGKTFYREKAMDDITQAVNQVAKTTVAPSKTDTKALAFYSPYGWMGKIGIICPSTNTSIEPEFNLMAPDGIAIHVARAYLEGAQQNSLYDLIASNVERASRELGTAKVDVIAFGCTSCTYFVSAEELKATMSRETGVQAIVTSEAVVDAFHAIGAQRIALATPRTEFVNHREVSWLTEQGFEVTSYHGLQLGETAEERFNIGRVPMDVAFRLAKLVDRPDTDIVFISCTNLPSLRVIARIEQEIGKPVVTSNQATMWRCLRTLGLNLRLPGFGRLLEEH
jgi:arylmalonate decarboxylase